MNYEWMNLTTTRVVTRVVVKFPSTRSSPIYFTYKHIQVYSTTIWSLFRVYGNTDRLHQTIVAEAVSRVNSMVFAAMPRDIEFWRCGIVTHYAHNADVSVSRSGKVRSVTLEERFVCKITASDRSHQDFRKRIYKDILFFRLLPPPQV